MIIQTKTGKIIFTVVEVAPESLPASGDRKLSLEVHLPCLTVKDHMFWVTRQEWEQFLAKASQLLSKRRTGDRAELQGMSPQSCRLEFLVLFPGQIQVTVFLNEFRAGRTGSPELLMSLVDELDPHRLPQLEKSLEA